MEKKTGINRIITRNKIVGKAKQSVSSETGFCLSKVITALLVLLQLAGCSGKESSENKTAVSFEDKKIIRNFTLVETEGDRKKWVMDAESARFKEAGSAEILEINDFTVKFFKEDKVQAFLKARKGNYNKRTQSLQTSGKVEIETESKKIATENVIWDPVNKLFVTEEDVIITTEDGALRGRGMEASMDLKVIKIKNEIAGEIRD